VVVEGGNVLNYVRRVELSRGDCLGGIYPGGICAGKKCSDSATFC